VNFTVRMQSRRLMVALVTSLPISHNRDQRRVLAPGVRHTPIRLLPEGSAGVKVHHGDVRLALVHSQETGRSHSPGSPWKAVHSSPSRSEESDVFERAEFPGRRRMLRLTVTVKTSPLCSSSTASCCSCRVRSRKSEDPLAGGKTPQWVSGGVLSSAHEPPPASVKNAGPRALGADARLRGSARGKTSCVDR
jgi:hypothetical protein